MGSDSSTFSSTTMPIGEVFDPENINLTDGIKLKEITSLSDSYAATSYIVAGYVEPED